MKTMQKRERATPWGDERKKKIKGKEPSCGGGNLLFSSFILKIILDTKQKGLSKTKVNFP